MQLNDTADGTGNAAFKDLNLIHGLPRLIRDKSTESL
jgi:hypothetical protein